MQQGHDMERRRAIFLVKEILKNDILFQNWLQVILIGLY